MASSPKPYRAKVCKFLPLFGEMETLRSVHIIPFKMWIRNTPRFTRKPKEELGSVIATSPQLRDDMGNGIMKSNLSGLEVVLVAQIICRPMRFPRTSRRWLVTRRHTYSIIDGFYVG